MKITPEIFEPLLRKMIEEEEVCQKCPIRPGFSNMGRDIFGKVCRRRGYEIFLGIRRKKSNGCRICQEFVDTTIDDCPCFALGHDKAIAAAHAALELWDAGEHPMQEKGK